MNGTLKFLDELNGGTFKEELAEKLREANTAVKEYGGKASITIKLTMENAAANPHVDEQPVTVAATMSIKVPVEKRATLFFTDVEGNPTRDFPKQKQADIEGVAPITGAKSH